MAETRIAIGGAEVVLDPSGALWIEESCTLVVADLHLEKSSSFARFGQMLPPYDTAITLAALAHLVERRRPRRVICLGDSFHDDGGFGRLPLSALERLGALQSGREWIWIAGNHDPNLPSAAGGDRIPELILGVLSFRHEPSPTAMTGEIAGHLHPAAKLRGRAGSVRCRAFASDGIRMILPAFGVLAGGLNLLDRAFAALFAEEALRPVLIGRGRLFPVPFSALCPD
jgi:DNA ligase-associated metallophosphoesterase